ncbi:MAG: hypothetical protein AAGH65_08140 [Pseudomonadota bacterium]
MNLQLLSIFSGLALLHLQSRLALGAHLRCIGPIGRSLVAVIRLAYRAERVVDRGRAAADYE